MLHSALASSTVVRAQNAPVTTVGVVDLQRYAGTWYEIARLPNEFQRECAGQVTATYTPVADGRIEVVNRCRTLEGMREAVGIARPSGSGAGHARLEVRFAPAWLSFLPFVWGDYWIIDLADDYSTAIVGSPDRKFLWLLARTPGVTAPTFARLVAAAAGQGFATDHLQRTPQE